MGGARSKLSARTAAPREGVGGNLISGGRVKPQVRPGTLARPPSKPAPSLTSREPPHLGSALFSGPAWDELGRSLRLTKRELQIVRGIFDDRTEFAIAADLGISPHTVHTQVERLRHKLAVVDRVALVLQVVEEFLRLTAAPGSGLPPICAARAAGQCHLRD